MVQLIIPSAFQIAIEATVSGQQVINVIGVRTDDVTKTAIQVGAAVKAAWETPGGPLALLPPPLSMIGYRTTDLRSSEGMIHFAASSASGGGSSTQLSTLAVAALVQYGQGTRNRSSRGRMYFGPMTENNINPDGRTLLAAANDVITSTMNAFRVNLGTDGLEWAVLSRTRGVAYPIETLSVASIVATQRRRLR